MRRGARSQFLFFNERLRPLLVSERTILPAAIVLDSEELLPRAYRGRRRYGSCLGGGPQGYAYASGRRGTRAGNSGETPYYTRRYGIGMDARRDGAY